MSACKTTITFAASPDSQTVGYIRMPSGFRTTRVLIRGKSGSETVNLLGAFDRLDEIPADRREELMPVRLESRKTKRPNVLIHSVSTVGKFSKRRKSVVLLLAGEPDSEDTAE